VKTRTTVSEKLIEESSMFRKTLQGRFALDIIRTVLQTAVAAGVPVHETSFDAKKKPSQIALTGLKIGPAMTYSPTGLPLQYHRRWRTLLPSSEWDRVWPLRYRRRKILPDAA
jgi:hypothetical protein